MWKLLLYTNTSCTRLNEQTVWAHVFSGPIKDAEFGCTKICLFHKTITISQSRQFDLDSICWGLMDFVVRSFVPLFAIFCQIGSFAAQAPKTDVRFLLLSLWFWWVFFWSWLHSTLLKCKQMLNYFVVLLMHGSPLQMWYSCILMQWTESVRSVTANYLSVCYEFHCAYACTNKKQSTLNKKKTQQ